MRSPGSWRPDSPKPAVMRCTTRWNGGPDTSVAARARRVSSGLVVAGPRRVTGRWRPDLPLVLYLDVDPGSVCGRVPDFLERSRHRTADATPTRPPGQQR